MRMLAAAALASSMIGTAASALTISTLDRQNQLIWGCGWNADACGQTFTLKTQSKLESVTFVIDDYGRTHSFIAYLFAWDNAGTQFIGPRPIGPALSSVAGTTAGVVGYREVTSSLGDVIVPAGMYIAFLLATDWVIPANTSSFLAHGRWGVSAGDPLPNQKSAYDGGQIWFNFFSPGESLTSKGWARYDVGGFPSYPFGSDLAFEIAYEDYSPVSPPVAPVPLPAALPFALMCLGALAALRRRKRA